MSAMYSPARRPFNHDQAFLGFEWDAAQGELVLQRGLVDCLKIAGAEDAVDFHTSTCTNDCLQAPGTRAGAGVAAPMMAKEAL